MSLDRKTIRKYIEIKEIPSQPTKIHRLSILDKYIDEIRRSITEGTNVKNIYHLIREKVFEGSYSSVRKKVHSLKNSNLFKNINAGKLMIDKQSILKLLCKSTSNLTSSQVAK